MSLRLRTEDWHVLFMNNDPSRYYISTLLSSPHHIWGEMISLIFSDPEKIGQLLADSIFEAHQRTCLLTREQIQAGCSQGIDDFKVEQFKEMVSRVVQRHSTITYLYYTVSLTSHADGIYNAFFFSRARIYGFVLPRDWQMSSSKLSSLLRWFLASCS